MGLTHKKFFDTYGGIMVAEVKIKHANEDGWKTRAITVEEMYRMFQARYRAEQYEDIHPATGKNNASDG